MNCVNQCSGSLFLKSSKNCLIDSILLLVICFIFFSLFLCLHDYLYSWGSNFRHTKPITWFGILSLVTPRHIVSEKPNRIGRVGNPISLYSPLNYGSDAEPTGWLPVSLEGYFSLVLLEIFMHPYPTLVRHNLNLLPNQVPNQCFCFSMGLHTQTRPVLTWSIQ